MQPGNSGLRRAVVGSQRNFSTGYTQQIDHSTVTAASSTQAGGALVDESRRVGMVGVVAAKLSARAALAASPDVSGENVNYAVKSPDTSGLAFLESVPEVSAKLKEPNTKEKKFEEVVKEAEQAAVLVLVY